MPTLNWIGKDKVINHHLDVPFRTLVPSYSFGDAETAKDNLIIHGDNLEALKALLPQYEGKVKLIYIDPPYNTGNEGWVYNDNVNDPKIKKWLGEVVGKEGEDLSRHDKWLCMMYPRIKLLKKLLCDDGIICMSLDGNEHRYGEILFDEIFGSNNRLETLVWKKSYGGGSKSKQIVNLHEYILCFALNKDSIGTIELPPNEDVLQYYKYEDSKKDIRGPYRLQPLATNSMDARPNLRYPIRYQDEDIWPEKQWFWSKERTFAALENDELVLNKKNNKWSVNYKQYLRDSDGEERGSKLFSIIDSIYTQQGTNAVKNIFGDGKAFGFPKPAELIIKLLYAFTNPDSIILDSFAGSGTTAHAVLKLNQEDGGHRKFIMIEMEDYAETITAERVRRVINGYGAEGKEVPGTGGGFSYLTLGPMVFTAEGALNPEVEDEALRQYIWYAETKTALHAKKLKNKFHLGSAFGVSYYFYYIKGQETVLDFDFLKTVRDKDEQYVIYADSCAIDSEYLKSRNIAFKKIPRDIPRY